MKVSFKKTFIKDFENLPSGIKEKVKEICLFIFPKIKNLTETDCDLKKIKGFEEYYRIRVGNHRIGFKKQGSEVIFMRVLHRKDIYRYFP